MPQPKGRFKHWLDKSTEPVVLFPLLAIVLLSVIWAATFNVIAVQRTAAERAALESSSELVETYEAQVIRALREIDQNLKFIQYAFQHDRTPRLLETLSENALLLPELLFEISLADRHGNIIETTRSEPLPNIGNEDYFRSQLQGDAISIGHPKQDADTGEWKLYFSRRLSEASGDFAGIVMIAVDAAYFVSGYEHNKLGKHGVLGLVSADGVFRAKRSGDTVDAGTHVDYRSLVQKENDTGFADLSTHPWDGEQRYTAVRQLYEFPLAVIVGLSQGERLAPSEVRVGTYIWRAAGASALLLLVLWLLGSMSHALALSRKRAVAAQMAHAERVEYLAYHDGLTGLPNRSLLTRLLKQSITEANRYRRQLALLFLDLDHFKLINDTLGHEAGDDLLKEVARRLKAALRDSDTVARLGGDEFVVLLPAVEDARYCATVADKILASVARPYLLADQEMTITVSIGISIYPQDGLDEQTLKKNADIAMYQAKQGGKNNFRVYQEDPA